MPMTTAHTLGFSPGPARPLKPFERGAGAALRLARAGAATDDGREATGPLGRTSTGVGSVGSGASVGAGPASVAGSVVEVAAGSVAFTAAPLLSSRSAARPWPVQAARPS